MRIVTTVEYLPVGLQATVQMGVDRSQSGMESLVTEVQQQARGCLMSVAFLLHLSRGAVVAVSGKGGSRAVGFVQGGIHGTVRGKARQRECLRETNLGGCALEIVCLRA